MGEAEWLKEIREDLLNAARWGKYPEEAIRKLRLCVDEIDRLTAEVTNDRKVMAEADSCLRGTRETMERQRAEVERLRGALTAIVAADEAVNLYGIGRGGCIARMALSPGESGTKEGES